MEQHKEGEGPYCAVPSYTFLKPGSSRVEVMIKNITARPIVVKSGERIARVEPANAVPNMLAPKLQEDKVPVVHKSAEVGLEARKQGSDLKQQPRGSKAEPKRTKVEVDRTPLSTEQIEVLLTKNRF